MLPYPTLNPMATAPRAEIPDKLLVVDEFLEMGQPVRTWKLVYWLDAFDGRPSGWYGNNCGDLRNPVGWVCVLPGGDTLSDLPAAAPTTHEYELLIDTDDDAVLECGAGLPFSQLHVLVTGRSVNECRAKLREYLGRLQVVSLPNKDGHARELQSYLHELAKARQPEGYRAGGNRTVTYRQRDQADFVL